MWEEEDGQFKLKAVLAKFKAYTKSQSNQINTVQVPATVRCLKQDDMPLVEFLTKA